jgi:hypothetical protein
MNKSVARPQFDAWNQSANVVPIFASSVIAAIVGDWNRDAFGNALGSRLTAMSFASTGSQHDERRRLRATALPVA